MKFVKSFPIAKLKPFDRNPRKHDEDIDQLIKSIEHFGWTNPILVQTGTNRVIAGHGRLEAAKRAKLRSVPAMFLDMTNKDARAKKMTIRNDDLGHAGTKALVATAARAWPLKPGGAFYVCGPSGDQETAFRLALTEAGFRIRQCLVWVKNHFVMGRQDYQQRHESILYGWATGETHYFLEDRTQDTVIDEQRDLKNLKRKELVELVKDYRRHENTTVWREDRPTASILHPTTKPIALIQKAMRNSSRPGDTVFDGFGGSGSTLIAAESIGRSSVLIELDPRYCDVTLERWKTTTGSQTKLLSK